MRALGFAAVLLGAADLEALDVAAERARPLPVLFTPRRWVRGREEPPYATGELDSDGTSEVA